MNRQRYTRQNILDGAYYQLPKFLFDREFLSLSNDARVLYALLRNRHEISIKNGWFDENDEVFLYFKRDDMQEALGLSKKTVIKAMSDLKEIVLLEEKQQGLGKPNMIYLLTAGTSRGVKFTPPEVENLHPNQKEIIQNKESQNKYNQSLFFDSPSCQSVLTFGTEIKRLIGYEYFLPQDKGFVDEIVSIIDDALMTPTRFVKIDGENKPRDLVCRRLMELTHEDVEHVITQFKGLTTPIKKKRQYILTMLYNCKLELDAHYTNAVNADWGCMS